LAADPTPATGALNASSVTVTSRDRPLVTSWPPFPTASATPQRAWRRSRSDQGDSQPCPSQQRDPERHANSATKLDCEYE
jgi:hypothetical protein